MTTAPEIIRDPASVYKYQWARYLSRTSLEHSMQVLKNKIDTAPSGGLPGAGPVGDQSLREYALTLPKLAFGNRPKKDGEFKVGIVGAGVSGLFTALLIDYLNVSSKGKLNISYDILEASGPERVGGRLYTHYFSKEGDYKEGEKGWEHDYYDVGAMRLPKNQVMERTFRLFNFLGITEGEGRAKLRRYYFLDQEPPHGVNPSYYNDVRHVGRYKQYNPKGDADPFKVNEWTQGLPEDEEKYKIPAELIKQDPNHLIDLAIGDYVTELRKDMDKREAGPPPPEDKRTPGSSGFAGWDKLMEADFQSTRQFFRTKGYNFNTIEWLETFGLATGWYNQSFAETVLEALDFDKPNGVDKDSNDYWWCIDGGTQQVPFKMLEKLKGKQPETYRKVVAITNDRASGDIKLRIQHNEPKGKDVKPGTRPQEEERSYFTVFNSTTLGALQKMDLTKADLNYGTKQAIRSLNYGASTKVGIKFKTGWWLKAPYNIKEGGLGRTDLPLRVCVYPSYNVKDDVEKPMVLLCSYQWGQDAQRMGGLISPHSPEHEHDLVDLMLENLARLHAPTPEDYPALLAFLQEQYVTHYAYDWYHDPNMLGAFGYFGPGQFSQMWPEIIKPSGWLFFIGEVASAHHGWICGAIESSVRAVWQLLETLQLQGSHEDPSWSFTGYEDAMKLLVGPKEITEHDVPFIGLPREIPLRQAGTEKEQPVQNVPTEAAKDLTFTAAQVITAFLELVVEISAEEGGKTGGLKVQ